MWACTYCSFHNTNDTFLACGACGGERLEEPTWQASELDFLISSSSSLSVTAPVAAVQPVAATLPAKAKRNAPPPPPIKPATVAASKKKPDPLAKIKPILTELVESERTYVTELQAIVSVFLLPLKARAQQQQAESFLISESDCNAIFGNVSEILRLNLDLVQAFDRVVGNGKEDVEQRTIELCQVFQSFVPHLKMYAFYAITFDEGTALLKKLEEEKPKFAEFLQAASSMNSIINSQPLSAFLIKPIQRVCKYPLFFHQILKALDEETEEDDALPELKHAAKQTLAAAGDVATKINQDKLRAEQNLRGFEVAKRIEHLSFAILEPGRRYIGEWKCLMSLGDTNLAKKRRSSTINVKTLIVGEKKNRSCFLFNNALLVCKEVVHSKTKQTFDLKLWISLDQIQLCGINANDQRQNAVPTSTPESTTILVASDGFGSYSKQFKLPLDLVHLPGSDRALTATLRDKQASETQAGQPLAQFTRQATTLLARKKSSNTAEDTAASLSSLSPSLSTDVTSHTMWFRSPAERSRVDLLLQRVVKDFLTPPVALPSSLSTRYPPTSPLKTMQKSPNTGSKNLPSPARLVPVPAQVPTVPATNPEQRKSRPRPPPPPPPLLVVKPPPLLVAAVQPKDELTSKWFEQ
ncbi:hypothetical protein BASA81_005521 [Batrachochytrium salamandrivorans]|nr:hypothetical protein BASA81_005521 [Batrachochytrium salamandrivorans]